jgi:hypothetical protein
LVVTLGIVEGNRKKRKRNREGREEVKWWSSEIMSLLDEKY